MPKPPEFEKAFAASRTVAWTLGGCLLVYLLLEEIIRARFRPFFGFAKMRSVTGLRYGGFIVAVAAVIVLRLLHGRRLATASRASEAAAVRSLYRTAVLTLTLAEIPALLGMSLVLLAGLNMDFYLLLFVSIVLLFMYFPRASAWEAVLEKRRPGCPF